MAHGNPKRLAVEGVAAGGRKDDRRVRAAEAGDISENGTDILNVG